VLPKVFTPKFDVKETSDAYELFGDLPGIEQQDVQIEFTGDQTLAIKGRTERTYSSNSAEGGISSPGNAGAITEGGEHHHDSAAHRATVEDEGDEGVIVEGNAVKSTGQEVARGGGGDATKEAEEKPRFWVEERSVGEFSRSFTFPVRVDQDRVRASMRNGVLNIAVPKAKKVAGRRIAID